MDRTLADWLLSELNGKAVGGRWRVQRYINHGKSGAVFAATDGGETVALKIFDPALVEKYGETVIGERLNRELLVGSAPHPNLVHVLDAGKDGQFYYLVMELIDAPSLQDVVSVVPRNRIRELIGQLAAAAEHLENIKIVHRDIKPANIAVVEDFAFAKLLDFGVVRVDHAQDVTGPDEFLGTKRYAPPEFLLRQEADSIEGWRAITFYQLGGVLHDMIMRQRLFNEYSNEGQLITAITSEVPRLNAPDVSPDLVTLAAACLIKNPLLRLQLVGWDSFRMAANDADPVASLRTRIATRRISTIADAGPIAPNESGRDVLKDVMAQIEAAIRRIVTGNNQDFPPLRLVRIEEDVYATLFRASKRYAMRNALTVYVAAEILDSLSQVVALTSAAIVCEDAMVGPQNSPDIDFHPYLRSFYQGIFTNSIVAAKIEEVLYKALDAAQATEPELLSGNYVVIT